MDRTPPDPVEEPTVSVERAAAVLGIGRTYCYEQARLFVASKGAAGIPAVRVGRRLLVQTKPLLELVGAA